MAARDAAEPLRIDVWGHLYGPMRTLSLLLGDAPELTAEVGRSRDLPSVLSALARRETDAGFGRATSLPALPTSSGWLPNRTAPTLASSTC
jgi:hypothetical protein